MTPPASDSAPAIRHFLDLTDQSASVLRRIVDCAKDLKQRRQGRPRGAQDTEALLPGHVLALIFEQVSTRTRVSFDIGMRQLGGETLFLTGNELQLGRGESIADTARVLSRYVDGIMIRVLSHDILKELAAHAQVPVINGLTRHSHPCQILADIMTFEEHKGSIEGRTIAWVGDANNVAASWIHAAARFDFSLRVASPDGYGPSHAQREWIRREGAQVTFTEDPAEAVAGADGVVTDTWVSLGDEDAQVRFERLSPYRVDGALMARAQPDAVFLHCLPAHRGEEVTADVIDGPRSVVWDEAENRLHAQKGILAWCLGAI
ncbi:MAG: ornithine carbamoyltransferase [Alphaproteobacteria bacterium]